MITPDEAEAMHILRQMKIMINNFGWRRSYTPWKRRHDGYTILSAREIVLLSRYGRISDVPAIDVADAALVAALPRGFRDVTKYNDHDRTTLRGVILTISRAMLRIERLERDHEKLV